MIEAVADDTFEREVMQSDKPVLVDFHAAWCGPCKALMPVLTELEKEFGDGLKIVLVDVDACFELVREYRVRAYPTIFLMKSGRILEQVVGFAGKTDLLQILKKNKINKEAKQ